ncbi:MAG TPA: S8 family serine peptidase, partial [Acidimicrobiales bacterium]|nr:S8 family serine peptidase [Acidimicrobiales bacterium]
SKKPPVRLLVSFDRGTSEAAQDDVADRAGTIVREVDQIDLRVVEVPAARALAAQRSLSKHGSVRAVEADTLLHADVVPDDDLFASQQQATASNVNLPAAWDLTTGDSGTVIAVVDTGVTPSNPELPASKVLSGRNVITGTSSTGDDNGHGTASAAVAAMVGNNNAGAAGACWLCLILPVKALGSNGSGTAAQVASGIVWAADNGADVINLSLSGSSSTSVKNAVDYAEGKGIVVVASAGNNSSTTAAYPAAHPTVLGVAASTLSDAPTTYTNRGSWVKLAAPGTNVGLSRSGSLISFAGTSSAAPLVSGIAALLESENPGLTPAQVRAALMSSALDVPFVSSSGGRVNAGAALTAIGATPSTPSNPDPSTDPGGPAPPVPTDITGGGYTSSGVVTRTLTARAGAFRFEARCSWCGGMTLEVLDFNGNVVHTLSGDQRFAMAGLTIPYDGTFFFRVRALRWGVVSYFITYNQ